MAADRRKCWQAQTEMSIGTYDCTLLSEGIAHT